MRIRHQWCSHLFNHCHSSVEEREQLKAKYYSNRQPGFIVLDTSSGKLKVILFNILYLYSYQLIYHKVFL